jgi:hypothetical protein
MLNQKRMFAFLLLKMFKNSEQGFTLSIAISLGFLMILSAIYLISNSNSKKMHSLANEDTSQVLAINETGVTRYQEFLAENSAITTYPDCAIGRDSNGSCQDTNTENSWSKAENIFSSSAVNFCTSTTGSSSQATVVSNEAMTLDWKDIEPGDPTQGQYRLVSYNYGPTVGVTPGTGTLTVEARVPQQSNIASSVIEVTIPVSSGSASSSIGNAGLWINWNAGSSISGGSSQIQSNIRDSTCSIDTDTSRVDNLQEYQQYPYMTDGQTYTYNSTPGEPFPSLPAAGQNPPTGTGVNTISVIDNSTVSLPQAGDTEVNNTFTYNVTDTTRSIDLSGGVNLTINAGANKTVILYLNGEMVLSGGSSIIVDGGTRLIIYAHNKVTLSGGSTGGPIQNNSGTADFIQLYNYSSEKVTLSGGSGMNVFVFAPNSLVEQTGASVVSGTIWSRSWKASGGSIFDHGDTNLANVLSLPVINPTINEITSWKRKTF